MNQSTRTPDSGENTHDPRDKVWQAVFDTYYDAYFEELCAEKLIKRWQSVDDVTKVLVALTVTGSSVAGWALWMKEPFRYIWLMISGTGALLAIIHSALGVSSRVRDWSETYHFFSSLRIDLETLRYQMQINPDFSSSDKENELLVFRKRYKEGVQRMKNDILRTRKYDISVQNDLDSRLANELEQP